MYGPADGSRGSRQFEHIGPDRATKTTVGDVGTRRKNLADGMAAHAASRDLVAGV